MKMNSPSTKQNKIYFFSNLRNKFSQKLIFHKPNKSLVLSYVGKFNHKLEVIKLVEHV